jgi:hypothetical protein
MVLRMGFEPMIFTLKGCYPWPLDERSINFLVPLIFKNELN